jgi:hypothetical protein
MKLEEHAQQLGGLVANFQSLEFAVRVFLTRQPGARAIGFPDGTDIYVSPVGTVLPESDLTSYDSLGDLVAKFNTVAAAGGTKQIDADLVNLRDALAHGRVSAPLADEHLRLLKFERPKDGAVKVSFNEVMTMDWFKNAKARVIEAIDTVRVSLES